jgi:cell division protein FtsI (penicillin-binding protein 3)
MDGFGYGVSITPMQTLVFIMRWQMAKWLPQFVSEIKEWNKTIKKYEKEVLNPRVCSRDHFKVKSGFSQRSKKKRLRNYILRIFQYRKNRNSGGELRKSWWSWKILRLFFVGYFPAEEPKYSCIVVVHKPSTALNNYYGADVAGPVFKRIAQKNFYRCAFNK